MLNSLKLKTVSFFCIYFFSQALLAQQLRSYTILQATADRYGRFPFVGDIKVDDTTQELQASLFFPQSQRVSFLMSLEQDGQTITLRITPPEQPVDVSPLNQDGRLTPIAAAIRTAIGLPSAWFANPGPVVYQFQLPALSSRERIVLNRNADRWISGVSIRFVRDRAIQIENIRYLQGRVRVSPRSTEWSRTGGIWEQMSDAALLQLVELLVVVLISPRLVQRSHHDAMLESERGHRWQRPLQGGQQTNSNAFEKRAGLLQNFPGYILWILGRFGWERYWVPGQIPWQQFGPQGFGLLTDKQGQRLCKVQPTLDPTGFFGGAGTSSLSGQFSGMNIGVPPQNCRNGWQGWDHSWGHGKDPDSDQESRYGGGYSVR